MLTATPTALTDKNLYAYCDNNPVNRSDAGGAFWETAFDLVSLGISVAEVCSNPTDPWAWAGLVGDAIDLVPFVTGVGEITKAVKTIDKIADTADVANDVKKSVSASKRAGAVRKAWKNEYNNVLNGGEGVSRTWSKAEKIELLSKGKVKGYEGHYMKSVRGFPDLAGDPDNIQFLTRADHLKAHGGNWRNITYGRYTK